MPINNIHQDLERILTFLWVIKKTNCSLNYAASYAAIKAIKTTNVFEFDEHRRESGFIQDYIHNFAIKLDIKCS